MTKLLILSIILSFVLITPSLVGALPTGVQNTTISSLVGASPTEGKAGTFLLQGFNFPADEELAANIAAAFTDALGLLHAVVDTAAWDTPTFDLYFPPETRGGVATTYRNMLNGADSQLHFDNYPRPDGQDPEHRDVCVSRSWAAFAMNDPEPAIHVCPSTWNIPKLNDIVDKVCPIPQMALNMRFRGSILLHELSHLTVFHPGRRVRDVSYGPLDVQKLRKENPDEAINNADNYMWFALQVYWTNRCGKDFAPPTTNSPMAFVIAV